MYLLIEFVAFDNPLFKVIHLLARAVNFQCLDIWIFLADVHFCKVF